MRRKLLLFLCAFFMFAQGAAASDVPLTLLPQASVVGRGTLSYAFWDVYEATLYAPQGRWEQAKPFALSLKYYHAIEARYIADTSVREIRKQGFSDEVKLAAWNTQMKAIFPDVRPGTVLTAIFLPGQETTFYNGENVIGSIKGDEFGNLFFDIWLGENASEPRLRRELLGAS